MTAKQKANAMRFKKAIAEAKKLRKKNPKLTQAQAVKQAWAILYKTGKVSAVKTATKKPARKKATAKSYHKDTKSHNVRISVVSGIGKAGDYAKFEIATIKQLAKQIKKTIKETQILVNNNQSILNIISNSFDQKLTPLQTAKIIKSELMPADKKDPLKAFVKILSKKAKPAGKNNFPMKLPATVTIGSVTHWTDELLRTQKVIAFRTGMLDANVNMYKYGNYSVHEKKQIKKNIVTLKKQISDLKKHLASVKKHIK